MGRLVRHSNAPRARRSTSNCVVCAGIGRQKKWRISPEAVTEPWATPTKNKADVEKSVVQQVVMKFIERKRVKNAGTYLPISVYQTQGFPVDRILAYCEDTIEDPVLGTLYKVRLHSDETETIEEACKNKIYEMRQRGNGQARKAFLTRLRSMNFITSCCTTDFSTLV